MSSEKKNAVAPQWHVPQSMSDALKFAEIMANSDMVPQEHKRKPGNVLVCMQIASDLGVPLLSILQGCAVINGKPSIWGDLALALVKRHPEFEDCRETFDAARKIATCEVRRRGQSPVVRSFSMDEAKFAGLVGKGVWKQYPNRMLQMRARGFALRDSFPDALKGLSIREEVEDTPARVVISGEPARGVDGVLAQIRNEPEPVDAEIETGEAVVVEDEAEAIAAAKDEVQAILGERGEKFSTAVAPNLREWIGREPSSMDPPTLDEWRIVLDRLTVAVADEPETAEDYSRVPF